MFNYKEKRILIVLAIFLIFLFPTAQAAANPYLDVPANHWSYNDANKLASSKVTDANLNSGGFSPNSPMTRDESAALIAKMIGIGNSIENKISQGQIHNNLNQIKDTGKDSNELNNNMGMPTNKDNLDILAASLLTIIEVKELPSWPNGYFVEGKGTTIPPPAIQQSPITVPPSDQLLAQLKVELAEMPGGTSCTGGPDCYENSGGMSDGNNVAQPITDAPPRHGW